MENRKTKIISVVAVVALLLVVITATYAYFQAQVGDPAVADIKVNANTVDTFTFSNGSAITFSINQDNFASGKGNQTGSTYASAMLTANNKTNTATEHYYLYLNIESNTFTYSINESTPEIIMTVTDSAGNEVTDISTLNHVIVTGANNTQVSGYDITNKNGLITLFNNREITTTSSKEERWNIKVTFVNYDASQNANAGKSMSAKVMIQKEKINLLADYVKSLYVSNNGENSIYYHDSSLTNGAGDNSYRYAGGDSCTFNNANVQGAYSDLTFGASNETDCQKVYTIKSDGIPVWTDNSITRFLLDEKPVTWTDGACKTMDGESVNFGFVGGNFKSVTEATCKGNSYLVKTDDFKARVANLNMEYVGVGTWNSVNNFVCFGTNTTPCPTDNLYRIIGVFGDQVKLIKYDYATSTLLGADGNYGQAYTATGYDSSNYKGNNLANIAAYYWNNSTEKNTWSESLLNKTNLNTNFITNIGADWAAKIAETTWKVGGNTWENIGEQPAQTAYQNEIVSPVTTNTTDGATEYSAKIGLMYVSDYMYAASQDKWTLVGNGSATTDYRAATSVNWMYMGLYEWTISRSADTSDHAFIVTYDGRVGHYYVDYVSAVRPSFNLLSSITYVSGSGSANDPIVIN